VVEGLSLAGRLIAVGLAVLGLLAVLLAVAARRIRWNVGQAFNTRRRLEAMLEREKAGAK